MLTLFFYLAFLGGAQRHNYQKQQFLYNNHQILNKYISGKALIKDLKTINKKKWNTLLTIYLERPNLIIKIYTTSHENLKSGDRIFIKNLLLEKSYNNSQLQSYLQKENLTTIAFSKKLDYTIIKKTDDIYTRVKSFLKTAKENLIERVKKKLSPITFSLFSSIFLGIQNSSEDCFKSLRSFFEQWGIVHYLARSGFHIIIILTALYFIMQFIPINYFLKQIFITFIILLYTAFTYSSISYMRALLIYLLYFASILKQRPIYPLHSLSVVALISLLYNPIYLFFLDFQLSFGLSFALLWLNEIELYKKCKFSKNYC